MAALALDFVYVLTALWESLPLSAFLRWWARYRYRALATQYDTYIALHVDYGAPLVAALDQIIGIPRCVLDVSTGTGYAAEMVARRYPGATIAACDLSTAMLARARARRADLKLVCCDSMHLPFRDGMFDMVILNNAPPRLRELSRMVAPGGWLVLGFSAGARLPSWTRARLLQRLRDLQLRETAWGKAGNGLYIVGARSAPEVSR